MADDVKHHGDHRTSANANMSGEGTARNKATIIGTGPRVAPEKAWDSEKPPGGKIPEKSK